MNKQVNIELLASNTNTILWYENKNKIETCICIYEASDSITDGACGLVGKRGDTTMRELFYHFNEKFGKIIKKSARFALRNTRSSRCALRSFWTSRFGLGLVPFAYV